MEADGKYAFKVANKANKTEIKQAIEKIFNVEVEEISTLNVGKYTGMTSKYKKAIVTLKKGDTISFD